ncbi:membrane protein [Longispora fulva]|nr:membrane protein [Longispora fulva]
MVATGLATVLLGLVSGFFYAYACSVMVGLTHADDVTFIAAMQAVNAHVRNLGFAPSFFGALAITALAAALGWRRWRGRATALLAAAFLIYAVGGFLLTLVVNVPLNDQLATAGDPHLLADPAAVRAAYEGPWTTWNLVRTIASTVALALSCAALHHLGRQKAAKDNKP